MELEEFNPRSQSDALVGAKLAHALDLLRVELQATRAELEHYKDLANHRLAELETQHHDHETRLRQLQDSSTQFKFLVSLAAGGGLLSIIALLQALIK